MPKRLGRSTPKTFYDTPTSCDRIKDAVPTLLKRIITVYLTSVRAHVVT